MVLGYEHHNFIFDTARIAHENTQDSGVDFGATPNPKICNANA